MHKTIREEFVLCVVFLGSPFSLGKKLKKLRKASTRNSYFFIETLKHIQNNLKIIYFIAKS